MQRSRASPKTAVSPLQTATSPNVFQTFAFVASHSLAFALGQLSHDAVTLSFLLNGFAVTRQSGITSSGMSSAHLFHSVTDASTYP